MRWEWARSLSYLWRPPSSAAKRATESGGVGAKRRTIDGGNKQSGEVYHSVSCYLRRWMPEKALFSPLMVSSVFRSSDTPLAPFSASRQVHGGNKCSILKKKEGEYNFACLESKMLKWTPKKRKHKTKNKLSSFGLDFISIGEKQLKK